MPTTVTADYLGGQGQLFTIPELFCPLSILVYVLHCISGLYMQSPYSPHGYVDMDKEGVNNSFIPVMFHKMFEI